VHDPRDGSPQQGSGVPRAPGDKHARLEHRLPDSAPRPIPLERRHVARRSENFITNFMGIGLPTLILIALIAWVGEEIWRYIWIVGPVVAVVVLVLILRARNRRRSRRAAEQQRAAGVRRILLEAEPDLSEEQIQARIKQASLVPPQGQTPTSPEDTPAHSPAHHGCSQYSRRRSSSGQA
jgi:hypothetical protein